MKTRIVAHALLLLAVVLLAACCPFGSEIRSRPVYVHPQLSPAASRSLVAGCDRQGAQLRRQLEAAFVADARQECALPEPFADYRFVNAAGEAVSPERANEARAAHAERTCAAAQDKDSGLAALCPECRNKAEERVRQCRMDKGLVRSEAPVRMCSMIRF
ncbi:hypothetical protein C1924_07170 [Stenotrophomonas sp. ESTM1D_MKCIP4_1]|uniref:hypothetical protein n=1 Tax=Stenotrophomonas sp. ESTM1D_MKCIP4_1 TaxID=2072414 RepID=UPI000D53D531|nr:hypothetical protein [Stenotrophomonas sp. ESTM1D_MKCIP4_1]AWH52972.1 hypothetical protein C1924_07170 [Stenotrophomonas sp. ESTM1D_MKCIP4_1]